VLNEPIAKPNDGVVEADNVVSSHEPRTGWRSMRPSSFTAETQRRRDALLTVAIGGSVDRSKCRNEYRSPPDPGLRTKSVVAIPLICVGVAIFTLVSEATCTVSECTGLTQSTPMTVAKTVFATIARGILIMILPCFQRVVEY
jgi:hypothetical protein